MNATTPASVLIVDDEVQLLEALQDLLTFEGYRVRTATDGVEALEQVERERPALVLLDLMMPRMNGYEFVAELERRQLRAGLPIVIVTADGHSQRKAESVGAQGAVTKPFDISEILDIVALHLSAPR